MLPRLAAVDPELTYDLPQAITASTGLDALAQVIEPYVSIRANPMTDLICQEAIRRIAIALSTARDVLRTPGYLELVAQRAGRSAS